MLISMAVASAIMSAPGQDAEMADIPPRDAAVAIARWLDSVQVETEHGVAWPVAPADSPDIARNLYSGTPGVILFFIELNRATGDEQYLERARRGGDDLLASIPDAADATDLSLWTGVGGQGFVLNELAEATGDSKYLDGANTCVDLLVAHATDDDAESPKWSDTTDVVRGAAGSGLFLLFAHEHMGREDALDAAIRTGDWLLEKARRVPLATRQRGLEWAMTDDYPRMMPNFSHGTAGVAYFLAALQEAIPSGEETESRNSTRFRRAAVSGALALLEIADTDFHGCRVYHHAPDGEDLYYLGWCHGPVGTTRLFEVLGASDGEDHWRAFVQRGAFSLTTSGIPARQTPGFWNNVGQCCGSVGVASFALTLAQLRENEEYLAFAESMHRDLMTRATISGDADAPLLSWTQAEHRVRPEFLQAQTGYMQGAAGIGLWLLQLDAHQSGREWTLRFPDSPW